MSTKITKVNGHQITRTETGAYAVTIDGIDYQINGTGREWALNSVWSGICVKLGTFASMKAAASDLAVRTFKAA